jgi:riboflavin biosynthesis pyrimidine reductase
VILTRVIPGGEPPLDLNTPEARARLVELYRPASPDWLRLNLVGSVSGSAAGSDGTSETLTNPTDRRLLNVIRDLSDLVLVGAASVRAEGYFVPKNAGLAVVTGTGNLSGNRIVTTGQRGPLLVLCPATAAATVRHTLGDVDASIITVADTDGTLSPHDILGALRGAGYRSIVCEGGPSLAAQLIEAGVVDEICLTVSPVLNGSALPLFGGNHLTERRLTLTQLMADDASGLYSRWAMAGA